MKARYMPVLFLSALFLFCFFSAGCGDDKNNPEWEWGDEKEGDEDEEGGEKKAKPRVIWIDAAANFPDFADSKENIQRDLTLAKEAGFTHVVVDVRPTSGDVLFQTTKEQQVEWLGAWINGNYTKITRTATWDYLEAFIEAGHALDLQVYAGFNTFTGGNRNLLGVNGMLFRDAEKKEWATDLLTENGVINTLDQTANGGQFFNPCHEEVQEYLFGLLEDLASYKDLDGIILDRGRFDELHSDFSAYSRKKFEAYLGYGIQNFPGDVMRSEITAGNLPAELPTYFKQWLEFRAKTIHDFMEKARLRVKAKNASIDFGVYVGGWYSTYYGVGVNWASPNYNTSSNYPAWATANYQKYGYADLMDVMLIGAYASPTSVYGTNEWSVQGFCSRAYNLIRKDATVIGGPDVGNGAWATSSDQVVNQAITQSVDAAIHSCDGYFLFDMIHLKQKNQWRYVKSGVDSYLESLKK